MSIHRSPLHRGVPVTRPKAQPPRCQLRQRRWPVLSGQLQGARSGDSEVADRARRDWGVDRDGDGGGVQSTESGDTKDFPVRLFGA